MTAAVVALGACVLLLGVLVVGLLRSHAQVLRSLHDLGVRVGDGSADPVRGMTLADVPDGRGSAAPAIGDRAAVDVVGQTPEGDAVRLALVGTRRTTLMAFLTTGCASCASVWRDIADEPSGDDGDERLIIVTRGPEMESPAEVAALAPQGVTVVQSTEAWEAYGIAGAPYFVLVDGASGEIRGEGSAAAWGQVRELLGRATADQAHARGPRPSRRDLLTGRRREQMADRRLLDAGIHPGDASLFPAGRITDDPDA
jgi:hypothetical protein